MHDVIKSGTCMTATGAHRKLLSLQIQANFEAPYSFFHLLGVSTSNNFERSTNWSLTMAAQTLFNRIVTNYIPSAIPTNLERIDEHALGKVLIYASKPRKLMPWRKHTLKFTGWTFTSLLAAEQTVEFVTSIRPLREARKGAIHFDVRLDYEIREALFQLDKKAETKDDKNVCVTADMGKISYLSSDLFSSLSARTCKVNMEHPVVKEAVEKGGALFVITSIYEAERSVIHVSKQYHEPSGMSPSSSERSTCEEDDDISIQGLEKGTFFFVCM